MFQSRLIKVKIIAKNVDLLTKCFNIWVFCFTFAQFLKQIVFIMTFLGICIATILMDNNQHHQQSLKQFQGFQLLVV